MEPAPTGLIILAPVIEKYFSLLANDAILRHNGKGQGRNARSLLDYLGNEVSGNGNLESLSIVLWAVNRLLFSVL